MNRRTIRLANDLQRFVKQYQRKAQRRKEPNDRTYSRKTDQAVNRLNPETVSALLNDDVDVPVPSGRKRKGK